MSSEGSDQTSKDETPFELYAKNGLCSEEAERIRQFYGSNDIPEKRLVPFANFLDILGDP